MGASLRSASTPTSMNFGLVIRTILIESQVQQGAQEPTLLDIDEPQFSTDCIRQVATPLPSPSRNGHVATHTPKSLLESQSWESPAFLKRGRLSKSMFDPFVEEGDDFPDNSRRKRIKIGDGNGQWRFEDRTPSPEKGTEGSVFEPIVSSRAEALESAHHEVDGTVPYSPDNHKTAEAIVGKKQQVDECDVKLVDGTPNLAPFSPPSTTAEVSEIEESQDPLEPIRATSTSLQSAFSTSSSIKSDQGSEPHAGEEKDSKDSHQSAGRETSPDFGFDGSGISRIKKHFKDLSRMSARNDEFEQVCIDCDTDNSAETSLVEPSHGDMEQYSKVLQRETFLVQESSHESNFPKDDLSSQPRSLGHDEYFHRELLIDSAPALSELESEQVPKGSWTSDASSSPDTEMEQLCQRESTEYDKANVTFEEKPLDKVPSVSSIDDNSLTEKEQQLKFDERKKLKLEIIDLESEDEGSLEQPDISRSCSPHSFDSSNMVVAKRVIDGSNILATHANLKRNLSDSSESLASYHSDLKGINSFTPQSDHGVQSSSPEEETKNSRVQAVSLELEVSTPSSPNMDPLPESQKDTESRQESQVASTFEQVSEPCPSEKEGMGELQAENQEQKSTREPSLELPCTIQDSVMDPSMKRRISTPEKTLKTNSLPQPSLTAVQYAQDDPTLPTPQLTQSRSAGNPVPSAPMSPKETFRDGVDLRSLNKRPKSPQYVDDMINPRRRKPPTLIERLKAMRKLSSQRPQRSGNLNAVSSWFTPKTSGQFVPDSEPESEVDSLSEEDHISTALKTAVTFQTPEKQKPLANAFVRSPLQSLEAPSIAPYPVDLPPSQPPPPGFRTSLSYFVPLAILQSHFASSVDVLAIVLTATPVSRATSGPRDYNQTIYITDPSSSTLKTPTTATHIFRSHNECFPMLEKGDAVLLRDFKVQSFQRRLALLSTQSSAWAVFREDADVQVRGPPVEFGAEERAFARGLWRWARENNQAIKDMEGTLLKELQKTVKEDSKPKMKANKEPQKGNDIVRRDVIGGLGVDLPGSQEKNTKASSREMSMDSDRVLDSVEPPKRVLRPRGARGMPEKSESPTKAINRRSGTVFTGGLGEPKSG